MLSEAARAPDGDVNAQHPHTIFTTSSLLSPIVASMQTNEATLAHHLIDAADSTEVA
jgi:hypothetical protein